MKGLELSRQYYEVCGKPMLEGEFSRLLPLLAVGFVGSGSDRYGYDDDISQDHDFEPGFCIFLPGEDIVSRRDAFLLERAYARLPDTFLGCRRQAISPVGGNRNGVIRTADFYLAAAGTADGTLSEEDWLRIPDAALAEAVNGEVFFDAYGEFSRIRAALSSMPEDVRRKRLAGCLILMAQAGQYNFSRCLAHGEPDAAQLACHTFTDAAMKAFFLLHRRCMPYYKWSFRALRELEARTASAAEISAAEISAAENSADENFAEAISAEEFSASDSAAAPLSAQLSFLLTGDNRDPSVAAEKAAVIEAVSARFICLLREQVLTHADGADLETHAYAVNDGIRSGVLRTMSIFAAV